MKNSATKNKIKNESSYYLYWAEKCLKFDDIKYYQGDEKELC